MARTVRTGGKTGSVWLLPAAATLVLAGCGTPRFAEQAVGSVPYEIGRATTIPVTVALELAPEVPDVRRTVHPASEIGADIVYPLSAGEAIAGALSAVTENHFAGVQTDTGRDEGPRVRYRVLEYQPAIRFEPAGVGTSSYASARLAVRAEIYRGSLQVMSAVVFGTGHVTDSKIMDRYGAGPLLLEAATQDAILDAMYQLSAFFDNNRQLIAERLAPPATAGRPASLRRRGPLHRDVQALIRRLARPVLRPLAGSAAPPSVSPTDTGRVGDRWSSDMNHRFVD